VFADLPVGLRVDVDVTDPMALLGCGDERLAVVVAGDVGGAGGVLPDSFRIVMGEAASVFVDNEDGPLTVDVVG